MLGCVCVVSLAARGVPLGFQVAFVPGGRSAEGWVGRREDVVEKVLVVKNAWKRCSSKSVLWLASFCLFNSGLRRTMRRPLMCSDFFRVVNAV